MAEDELVYLGRDPLNAETRLDRQHGLITPASRHYVRNHFPVPRAPSALVVDGAVRTPLRLTIDELRSMPSRSLVVTLECAGNGRAFLEPSAPGEQWRLGAVSTAEWTGVPLRDVLAAASPAADAVEALFVGADHGTPGGLGREITYERSLSLSDAMHEDVLLAHAMNAGPLPPEHGAPLRLVVPGWYGMASVKWLTRITLIDRAFEGFYQKDRYVIDGEPLREIAPRAVITEPSDGASLARGRLSVRGYAWSGRDPIERVELSIDGGRTWRRAGISPARSATSWRPWQLAVEVTTGEHVFVARATTASGAEQPLIPRRSALGYANNGAREVRLRAT